MTGSLQEQWEHRSGHSCVPTVSRVPFPIIITARTPDFSPLVCLIVPSIHHIRNVSILPAPFDSWSFTRKHWRNRFAIFSLYLLAISRLSLSLSLSKNDISRGL